MKCSSSLRIITNDMPVAADQIFIGHQSFQTDRSARMDLSGRNADLSAESVAEAVREAGRNIPVYACRIHHLHKICRSFIIFCQDRIRVMRAEAVDMLTGFLP